MTLRNAAALVFISATSIVMASDVPFDSRTVIDDTYLGPTSLAVGDFDGDGLGDLVAAGFNDSSLAWYRNLGNGSFQRYPVVASAIDIDDVEVADVNGDGFPDVVVTAGDATDAVGWYENDGTPMDGGWPLRLIAYPFDGARGTAVGDVDGDGTLDVAGVAASAHVVSVALNNNGTGIGWSYETVDAAFTGAIWVSLGDIDGDGRLDVAAAATISGEVSWWSRGAGGVWTEHSIDVVAGADVLELVDVDLDGDLDALGAGVETDVRWWENDGSGGGWVEHTVGDPATSVLAAYACDVDADGDPDILYAANGVDGLGWYENTDGEGTDWDQHVIDDGFSGAMDVVALDLDNDGDLDLAGVDFGNEVVAWENLTIHREAAYPNSTPMDADVDDIRDLEAVDLDRDGDLDVVFADFSDGTFGWLENDPDDPNGWVRHAWGAGAIDAKAVSAADIDGDGDVDVIVGENDGELVWYSFILSIGAVVPYTITDALTEIDSVVTADFDGDGDVDVATGSSVDGIDWFENVDSVIWTPHSVTSAFIWDADCMAVADVDRDGDPDLVYSVWDSVKWLSNRLDEPSNDFAAPATIGAGLDDARSVAVGDLDSDGDPDVVAGNVGTGEVLWWENTAGDGSAWGAVVVLEDGLPKPQSVGLADLDLDGALEVVVGAHDQSTYEGWFGVLDRNSYGSWVGHEIDDYGQHFNALTIGDFDGEGTPDLVTDDGRFWPNLGGQAELYVGIESTPPTIDPGDLQALMRLVLNNHGRSGDADVELASLKVFFGDDSLTPLTDEVLDEVLVGVYVYEDTDFSYSLDPAIDEVVASVESFSTTDGLQVVAFVDGDGRVQTSPVVAAQLFLAIVFEPNAFLELPGGLVVSLPQDGVVIQDADHDIDLELTWRQTLNAGPYHATPSADLLFIDDFESGDTSAWTVVVP